MNLKLLRRIKVILFPGLQRTSRQLAAEGVYTLEWLGVGGGDSNPNYHAAGDFKLCSAFHSWERVQSYVRNRMFPKMG
jgi:hypothetical protein